MGLKDDILILKVLVAMDAYADSVGKGRMVSYLYSLIPKDDAARLMRKSTITE